MRAESAARLRGIHSAFIFVVVPLLARARGAPAATRRTASMRFRSRLAIAIALSLACSCASNEAQGEDFVGPPTQVRWVRYRSSQTITLVNRSHTDPLALYSKVRDEAGPKVTTDDVMDGLVKHFEDQDFERYAVAGPAPDAGGSLFVQALEVNVAGNARHMLLGASSTQEEREAFNNCTTALITVWNLTYQVQAVENEAGEGIFMQPGTRIHYQGR